NAAKGCPSPMDQTARRGIDSPQERPVEVYPRLSIQPEDDVRHPVCACPNWGPARERRASLQERSFFKGSQSRSHDVEQPVRSPHGKSRLKTSDCPANRSAASAL